MERIELVYDLFFHQILLNMCDMGRSGIRGDPRKFYYFRVENIPNIYGM